MPLNAVALSAERPQTSRRSLDFGRLLPAVAPKGREVCGLEFLRTATAATSSWFPSGVLPRVGTRESLRCTHAAEGEHNYEIAAPFNVGFLRLQHDNKSGTASPPWVPRVDRAHPASACATAVQISFPRENRQNDLKLAAALLRVHLEGEGGCARRLPTKHLYSHRICLNKAPWVSRPDKQNSG